MRPLRYSINVTLDGCCYHTADEDRLQWLPRVRRISADGKDVIIASVTR
jgi:hypothetical protein